MMQKIQNSTFDLLKSIDIDLYNQYSIEIILNTIKLLKKRKYKTILFFLNSEWEANIFDLLEYCLKHNYECYCVTYINKKLRIKQIKDLNIIFSYFLYTKIPLINDNNDYNELTFDIVYFPVLSYDKNKNFIDTEYNLINSLLDKINYLELWGYSFSFQEYYDLSKYSNKKLDFIINNFMVI